MKNVLSELVTQTNIGSKGALDIVLDAIGGHFPISDRSSEENDLQGLSEFGIVTCKNVPLNRWDIDLVDTRRFNTDARRRVRYGSFLQSDFASFDNAVFRIGSAEAGALEP